MLAASRIAVILIFTNEIFCRTDFLREHVKHYSSSWTVLVSGGDEVAQNIAEKEGFEIIEQVLWTEQVAHVRHELKNMKCPGMLDYGLPQYKDALPDKLWNSQWYLQECRISSQYPLYDLNVFPVWYKYKIFGKNIKVLIIDDGVETNHPDLRDNYDADLSWDFVDKDNTPEPQHTALKIYAHGTKCAGIVAMRAGNHICGAGIAPLATFGAIRLLGPAENSDKKDAKALSFRLEETDIISNSWGPEDDGMTMESLGQLVRLAIRMSIALGRNGKGIIYVFPSGNGKRKHDTCGSDGYVNSIYTIAIGGVFHDGNLATYSERCAGVMAVVYSGDSLSNLRYNLVTTDVGNKCTTQGRGTSAAVPVAGGIFSLLLEANYDLTWRGVQHVIVYTSQIAPLADNPAWKRNAAGFFVGHNFGFGMLDALLMVEFAKTMEPVPPMNSCVLRIKLEGDTTFNRQTMLRISFTTNGCQSLPSEVNYMEHVQLQVTAQYPMRGAIKINLHSPSETLSHMLESRIRDKSRAGLKNWVMDSVHMWGESPLGEWTVSFMDVIGRESYSGSVESLTLIIHGTKEKPSHYEKSRIYYKYTVQIKASELGK